MVDYKFIVERVPVLLSTMSPQCLAQGNGQQGFYQIRHFMLGCGELVPKRTLLKVSDEHGKGGRWLEQ